MVFFNADVLDSFQDLLQASKNTEEGLVKWLANPPHFTVLRINTLKYELCDVKSKVDTHLMEVMIE